MIPWLIFAAVVVPLVIVAFVATRRKTQIGETSAPETPESRSRTEDDFAAAEAYEATWHEEDKERFHRERLP